MCWETPNGEEGWGVIYLSLGRGHKNHWWGLDVVE